MASGWKGFMEQHRATLERLLGGDIEAGAEGDWYVVRSGDRRVAIQEAVRDEASKASVETSLQQVSWVLGDHWTLVRGSVDEVPEGVNGVVVE